MIIYIPSILTKRFKNLDIGNKEFKGWCYEDKIITGN